MTKKMPFQPADGIRNPITPYPFTDCDRVLVHDFDNAQWLIIIHPPDEIILSQPVLNGIGDRLDSHDFMLFFSSARLPLRAMVSRLDYDAGILLSASRFFFSAILTFLVRVSFFAFLLNCTTFCLGFL